MEGSYDIAVIGGGVAGLSAARLLSLAGYSVALFEKKAYPFHRVCGEYISRESSELLKVLGLDLAKISPPEINRFKLTLPGNQSLETQLPLGGIGLSRFRLDFDLAQLCFQSGVDFWEQTIVRKVAFENNMHKIETSQGDFSAKVCIGSFGKRSVLDNYFKRDFAEKKATPNNHFIAVKYHVKANLPDDRIELHVFDQGYCGISKIEDERFCMCYLTTAENLQKHGTIGEMEKKSLGTNPFLADYTKQFPQLFKSPQVISRISFDKRSASEDHVLMCGDAAGLISPLCGNGISIAIHSSSILAALVSGYLEGQVSRSRMESLYEAQWRKNFNQRMWIGRWLQKLFFKPSMLAPIMPLLNGSSFLRKELIGMTHGKPFSLEPSFQEKLSATVGLN